MQIIVETFINPGEPSSSSIRVRPLAGQFEVDYRVWCSQYRRNSQPPGALFLVQATLVGPSHGNPYLRIGLYEEWEQVTRPDAMKFVIKNYGHKPLQPY